MSFARFLRDLHGQHRDRNRGLIVLASVPSTNRLARRIAREYAREAVCAPAADLVAWRQDAGSGRDGRSWSSPPGVGVYATLVRPLAGVEALQSLPLRVAVGLCQALNRHLDGRCRLKWPNDLVVDGRKLGGILIDAVTRGDRCTVAVIGFGVNHRQPAPELARATSLVGEAASAPPALTALARELIAAIDAHLGAGSDGAIVDAYKASSVHRPGERLVCRLRDEVVEGVFQGFDDRGFLRLRTEGGERLLPAGEVATDVG